MTGIVMKCINPFDDCDQFAHSYASYQRDVNSLRSIRKANDDGHFLQILPVVSS